MAQCIARVNRPTLVMAHNKTLAAQLYQEFRRFFPENAVEYFVSYYDYYQPEAYVPTTDSYIEKEATINDEIDRMRLSATRSLFERRDVIIVASVSCIYGLGSPEAYYGMMLPLERGQRIDREQILRKLVEIQYERNDARIRAAASSASAATSSRSSRRTRTRRVRIELFGDEVDELISFDPLTGKTLRRHDKVAIYPKTHFVTSRDRTKAAVESIKAELELVSRPARIGGQGPRSAPAAPADDVRPRDDQGDRLLPRDRELRAAPDRPRAGRAAADAARLPAARRADRSSTRATRPCRRFAACITATGRARKCWSRTASGCRRRSTTVR